MDDVLESGTEGAGAATLMSGDARESGGNLPNDPHNGGGVSQGETSPPERGQGDSRPLAGDAGAEPPVQNPASQAPDSPEGYALSFAKDTEVDAALLKDFQTTAHGLGLTQAQAQKLAGLYESHAAGAAKAAEAAQRHAFMEARKKWEAGIMAQPGFAEERGHITAALRRFGDQELYDLLDQTNLGSHPKMWAFMAKVGKALAEPGFHGEREGAAKSAAEVLYPDMK